MTMELFQTRAALRPACSLQPICRISRALKTRPIWCAGMPALHALCLLVCSRRTRVAYWADGAGRERYFQVQWHTEVRSLGARGVEARAFASASVCARQRLRAFAELGAHNAALWCGTAALAQAGARPRARCAMRWHRTTPHHCAAPGQAGAQRAGGHSACVETGRGGAEGVARRERSAQRAQKRDCAQPAHAARCRGCAIARNCARCLTHSGCAHLAERLKLSTRRKHRTFRQGNVPGLRFV